MATLLLLASSSIAVAQPSVATANISISSEDGGRVNVTTEGNSTGLVTVSVDGRNKTIGATSMGTGSSNSTLVEIPASRPPPVMSPPDSDPTTGVPAPPVVSPPEDDAPPGSGPMAGVVSPAALDFARCCTCYHVFSRLHCHKGSMPRACISRLLLSPLASPLS